MSTRIQTLGVGGVGALQVRVKSDFSGVRAGMRSLSRKMSDMRQPLKKSAVDYFSRQVVAERFDREGIPKWKEHSLYTIKTMGSHKLLHFTGRLRRSATGGAGFYTQYVPVGKPNRIYFGSDVPYASVHDQPRGTMTPVGKGALVPGRPWSNITRTNIHKMRDIVMDWTQKKIKESGIRGR